MTTDLLVRLARLDRETHLEHDPRWDSLSLGELPRSEVDALDVASAKHGRADLFDAFSPLDAAAHERLTAHATSLVRARLRPSRAALAGGLAVGFCAAAAAIGLFIGLRRDPPQLVASAVPPDVAPPLPRYELEASGGDAIGAVRAAPEAPGAPLPSVSTLGAGTPFALVLRPATAVTSPVDVLACAVRGGRAEPWSAPWERSDRGSFRVEGTREALFAREPPGELTLLFAVGAAAALPSCASIATSDATGVALLTHRVVLR